MDVTNITPTYVYVSTTTPSDLTAGKLWVNTSTTPTSLYISDGATYNSITTDLTTVEKLIGLNALNILDLTAKASLTAGTNANFVRDIYTDSNGYLNSLDTGNTTATFSTNVYTNNTTADNNIWNPYGSTAATTTKLGYKILTTSAGTITKVTKTSACTGTIAYIYASDGTTLLGQSNFSGDIATFNLHVTNNTNYFIEIDKSGASYTKNYVSTTLPHALNGFNVVDGYPTGSTIGNVYGVTFTPDVTNKIVQTNSQSLSATYTKAFILSQYSTSGTGSITFDLSTNGGSNYQTGLSENTEITLTNAGTSLILKQNLNAGASNGVVNVSNYGVLLW